MALKPTPPASGAGLTGDIALNGDLLVVGAPDWKETSPDPSGGVFVFERGGSGWAQVQVLTIALDYHGETFYGWSVAISDDGQTIFVGAPGYGETMTEQNGRVFVYEQDISGDWTLVPPIGDCFGQNSDFGWDLDFDRDRLAVLDHGFRRKYGDIMDPGFGDGSAFALCGGGPYHGAVSVYEYDTMGGEWDEAFRMEASDYTEGATNLQSVTIEGGWVAAASSDSAEGYGPLISRLPRSH